jgi:O-antigen biosynthesis alpha-1,3-rhamnosyltransferase
MRVVFNLFGLRGLKTGVAHYTEQVLRGLRSVSPDDVFATLPGPWMLGAREVLRRTGSRRTVPDSAPASVSPGRGLRSLLSSGLRSGFRSLRSRYTALKLWAGRYDLYHEPNYIPRDWGLPTVTTIHDLSTILHPDWHPPERLAEFEKAFRAGLAHTAHVVTVSETVRQEAVRLLGLGPTRVTAVPNGVRPGLRPVPPAERASALRALGLPSSYLLYVGTLEPRKNLRMLMRAYCALPAALRQKCPLILAGGWGWKAADLAESYQSEGRHKGVLHVGYLPERHLAAVYSGARALAFPSLYEGFGLPPLEMLACGGAVLASAIGPHQEAVGGVAHLLEAADEGGWRDALARAIDDDDWLDSLRAGATRHARAFTWERTASKLLEVYRSLTARPQRRAA